MSAPNAYLIRMILALGIVGGMAFFLREPLLHAFMTNTLLNGAIAGVFALGVLFNIRQLFRLYGEVRWVDLYRTSGGLSGKPPRLLLPMVTMMNEQSGRFRLSAMSMRTLLDGIASRLHESREISRYIIGLLIFLGLIGTFWGLLITLGAVSEVVGGLTIRDNASVNVLINDLKAKLQSPLLGMSTAFSSSLFGLAGSLIMGFLDLQTGQAQNRFFNELEEWLSGVTRLSSGALEDDSGQSVPTYVHAVLERTADNLDDLQVIMGRGEQARIVADERMLAMTEQMEILNDHLRTQQMVMQSIVEGQRTFISSMKDSVESKSMPSSTDDGVMITHIRSMDSQMKRLTATIDNGRAEILQQIRGDLRMLLRALSRDVARDVARDTPREAPEQRAIEEPPAFLADDAPVSGMSPHANKPLYGGSSSSKKSS